MNEYIQLYSITLDFIFKITGPIVGILIIGLFFIYRKEISNFVINNIQRVRCKIFNQEIDIELRKREQSVPVLNDEEKDLLKKDRDELLRVIEFEKIYSIIFGTQIKLLRNTLNGYSIPVALYYFKITQQEFHIFQSWTFSDFVRVLENNLLINFSKDKNTIEITKKGLEFLSYIDQNNYNDRLF